MTIDVMVNGAKRGTVPDAPDVADALAGALQHENVRRAIADREIISITLWPSKRIDIATGGHAPANFHMRESTK